MDNQNKTQKLHIQKELSYEDLKTLRSAIDDDSKDGVRDARNEVATGMRAPSGGSHAQLIGQDLCKGEVRCH